MSSAIFTHYLSTIVQHIIYLYLFVSVSMCEEEVAELTPSEYMLHFHFCLRETLCNVEFATPCVTPNRDIGICVEIRKCDKLLRPIILDKKDHYPFLVASKCGPVNENPKFPKVCCGKYSNFHNVSHHKIRVTPFPKICGNQTMTFPSRIFGGINASLSEFPWMARLRHRSASGIFNYGCAGFLISEHFVLTAAHCVLSKELQVLGPIYQVQLGEHDTQCETDCEKTGKNSVRCADPPLLIRTAKPKVHPGYTNNIQHHNDIALLPLRETVRFSEFVSPICLASNFSDANEMWLSGWGKTEKSVNSPIKLKVSVRKANQTECSISYESLDISIMSSQLCAGGEEGIDSCSGDSGGPLMVQHNSLIWYAEGIVSFGLGCGVKDWPGVYTSIPSYLPWITNTIKKHLRKHPDSVN
ncbi:hypothetical protein FQA39_LY01670 [Lamprigera yunnana]|nr:hypothetical protein FQA39_LY01670 [Lamprigera yunnana]